MMGWDNMRSRYQVATNPLRSERKIELAALILVLLLCLQILYSGARLALGVSLATLPPAADLLQDRQVQGRIAVEGSQSEEIRSRPLFWQSRRPLAEVAVNPESVEEGKNLEKLKDVKLLGVFGSGETLGVIALVKGKKQRIFQGESINGWVLESVEPQGVVLTSGSRRQELVLAHGKIVASEQTSAGVKPAAEGAGVAKGKTGGKTEGTAVPMLPAPARRMVERTPPPVDNSK
jgi:hypothetical protein